MLQVCSMCNAAVFRLLRRCCECVGKECLIHYFILFVTNVFLHSNAQDVYSALIIVILNMM